MGGRIRAAVVLCVACGCGRIAFDPLSDGGTPPDGPCTEWLPFAAPVHVPPPVTTSVLGEWHPSISASGLSVYYYSIEFGGGDLMLAQRGTADVPFSTVAPIAELDTAIREANPTVTADERTIIFDRLVTMTDSDLEIATRSSATAPFDAPVAMTALNTTSSELSASLSPDGLELFFMRDTGVTTIYVSVRSDTAQPFTTIAPIDEVLPPAGYRNHHVAISPDDKELFLTSNRPGGSGGYDAWVSRRDGRGLPFSAPVWIPELASPGDDGVDSVSADGHTVYMFYNANLGANADISTATRSCR